MNGSERTEVQYTPKKQYSLKKDILGVNNLHVDGLGGPSGRLHESEYLYVLRTVVGTCIFDLSQLMMIILTILDPLPKAETPTTRRGRSEDAKEEKEILQLTTPINDTNDTLDVAKDRKDSSKSSSNDFNVKEASTIVSASNASVDDVTNTSIRTGSASLDEEKKPIISPIQNTTTAHKGKKNKKK